MRILISFLLFMMSFVFAQECKTVVDKEWFLASFKDQKNTQNCSGTSNDTFMWSTVVYTIDNSRLKVKETTSYIKCNNWQQTGTLEDKVRYLDAKTVQDCSIVEPNPGYPECNSGLKSHTWLKSLGVRIGDKVHKSSDKITTYRCDDPQYSYDYVHPRTDEPVDDSDADYTCSGASCDENLNDKLKDTDSVPCFGATCKPDYENDETFQGMYDGVPCFANNIQACNNWAPDYTNGNGVPCWGNFCSNDGKAPIYKDDNGKICVGPYCEGANGNLTDGSKVDNGNVTGPGAGANGSGSGDGDGESDNNNNTCSYADCTGSSIGKDQKIDFDKDSIYESKYDSSFSSHVSKNPISIENTSLGRMVNSFIPNLPASKCPAWTMPNLFNDDVIDLTPPCWIFDLIKSLVMIGSLILARKIVLGA